VTSHPAPTRARARWRRPALLALALLGVGIGLAAVRAVADARLLAAGESLFDGRAPLVARIGGHVDPLPPAVVACANCHRPAPQPVGVALSTDRPQEGGNRPAGPAVTEGGPARAALASPGPVLHRDLLLEPVPRRGGPPSRFDREAFCRLLQSGEDPAGVLLPRAMPRYDIGSAACDALWRYVTRS